MKHAEEYTMKIVGRRAIENKTGWTEEKNKFFQLKSRFRKTKRITPKGVFRFKTFEEADEWMYKVMIGKNPDSPQ